MSVQEIITIYFEIYICIHIVLSIICVLNIDVDNDDTEISGISLATIAMSLFWPFIALWLFQIILINFLYLIKKCIIGHQ